MKLNEHLKLTGQLTDRSIRNVDPVSADELAQLKPFISVPFTDEPEPASLAFSDRDHHHAWRFGVLLPSEGSLYADERYIPRSALLVCDCGELRRVRVPELER